MPTHNSFTYTHSHSKTFFYLTPNFHFDLISLSDSIHSFYQFRNQTLIQSISIKSEPHRTGALLVQDSIFKTVILLSKRSQWFS
ncbi:hypothetical protein CMV_024826 [Castanea mollissima]|uniref:Uncharacterized protein n=1 Tax=Castanea mollissima TaxID=60419 RepID=A0A8J4V5K8_9ROSI|nr:hypothetical protein CMV_024826 [Castanea mollissima]